jgi:hypothetical protein
MKLNEINQKFLYLFIIIILFLIIMITFLLLNNNYNKKEDFNQIKNKEWIGSITWKYIHTTIQNTDQCGKEITNQNIIDFLNIVANLFPCKDCSEHFLKMLINIDKKVKIREDFPTFVCKLHNKVNKRLKKNKFDCSKENLIKHYGMKKS